MITGTLSRHSGVVFNTKADVNIRIKRNIILVVACIATILTCGLASPWLGIHVWQECRIKYINRHEFPNFGYAKCLELANKGKTEHMGVKYRTRERVKAKEKKQMDLMKAMSAPDDKSTPKDRKWHDIGVWVGVALLIGVLSAGCLLLPIILL